MREKILYASWGCLYILCVGLGTIQEPAGFGKAVLVAISLLFFVLASHRARFCYEPQ